MGFDKEKHTIFFPGLKKLKAGHHI